MNVVVIIFMIVATLFALLSLVYIIVDIFLEKRKKEEPKEEVVEAPPVVVPVEEPVIPEVMPEIVEHIDAEEADVLISDEFAMEIAQHERGAGHGKQGIINIGLIDAHFEPNDVITLEVLKQKGLMNKKVKRMKVLADGTLNKPLTVKSESYSVQAIKMIELTGGTVIILED